MSIQTQIARITNEVNVQTVLISQIISALKLYIEDDTSTYTTVALIKGMRYSLSGGGFKASANGAASLVVPVRSTGTPITITLENMITDDNYPNVYYGTDKITFGNTATQLETLLSSFSITIPAGDWYVVFHVDQYGADHDFSNARISIANEYANIVITTDSTDAKFGEVVDGYTNLADPTSADWGTDCRIGSDGIFRTDVPDNIVTNYIELVPGDVVRIEGLDLNITTNNVNGSSRCGIYDNTKAVQSVALFTAQTLYFDDITTTATGGKGTYNYTGWAKGYIRFSGKPTNGVNNVIITVNEEIKDQSSTGGSKLEQNTISMRSVLDMIGSLPGNGTVL